MEPSVEPSVEPEAGPEPGAEPNAEPDAELDTEEQSLLETIVPFGRLLHGASAAGSLLWSGWGAMSQVGCSVARHPSPPPRTHPGLQYRQAICAKPACTCASHVHAMLDRWVRACSIWRLRVRVSVWWVSVHALLGPLCRPCAPPHPTPCISCNMQNWWSELRTRPWPDWAPFLRPPPRGWVQCPARRQLGWRSRRTPAWRLRSRWSPVRGPAPPPPLLYPPPHVCYRPLVALLTCALVCAVPFAAGEDRHRGRYRRSAGAGRCLHPRP
jgi:hypothetical protein